MEKFSVGQTLYILDFHEILVYCLSRTHSIVRDSTKFNPGKFFCDLVSTLFCVLSFFTFSMVSNYNIFWTWISLQLLQSFFCVLLCVPFSFMWESKFSSLPYALLSPAVLLFPLRPLVEFPLYPVFFLCC